MFNKGYIYVDDILRQSVRTSQFLSLSRKVEVMNQTVTRYLFELINLHCESNEDLVRRMAKIEEDRNDEVEKFRLNFTRRIISEVIPSLVTLFHSSAPATPYCEDFIVSVVLGKDAVPR